MDVIVGWIRLRSGERQNFMPHARNFAAALRSKPGCLFCELTMSDEDPDLVVLTEAFADRASHEASVRSEEEHAIIAVLDELGVEGVFENFSGERGQRDTLTFGGRARSDQLKQLELRMRKAD